MPGHGVADHRRREGGNLSHCMAMFTAKGRPNFGFGFGFGAECVQCSTSGIHSVSAERNSATFGKISVSAATMAEIRRTPKLGLSLIHISEPTRPY